MRLRSILLLCRYFCHNPLLEQSIAGRCKLLALRGHHAESISLADIFSLSLRIIASQRDLSWWLVALGFSFTCSIYIVLRRTDSPRRAAIAGAVFGGAHHALTSYWLFFYKGFAFWTIGTTTIAYAFVYATIGLYGNFILRAETKAYRPFVFALGWTVFEFFKSIGFLGYPWGLVPYSLTSAPVFLQIADLTGVYGLFLYPCAFRRRHCRTFLAEKTKGRIPAFRRRPIALPFSATRSSSRQCS